MDDYSGKFKDEHPISGYIISIASEKESRGNGATSQLLSEAYTFTKRNNKNLVTEIDSDNLASKNLFLRNNFKKMDFSVGDIEFYIK